MLAPILNQAQTRWYNAFVKLYFTIRGYATQFTTRNLYGLSDTVKSLQTSFTANHFYGKVSALKDTVRNFILRLK